MKLSISNIAWSAEFDEKMYLFLQRQGYDALEIAPTRIFSQRPYEHIDEARQFAKTLKDRYGLAISSMQSIWYGKTENIFASADECQTLIDYTKQAVNFAEAMECGNLVFGCPKNRNIPKNVSDYMQIVCDFFHETADYAENHGTVIALEANPPHYGTNFINTTAEAFIFCKMLNHRGLKVNVDLGTCINYGETLQFLEENVDLINHIHISEPKLAQIKRREIHAELKRLPYERYVSVEMNNFHNVEYVKDTARYIKEVLA